ncbi:glycosyltransferase [Frondihabitans sp. 4ASC-45]|uniref:glycosyltransferase n=1 Tax=Frondihabitans sp. 4ASC-45 TaxID=3111636 RepID=UPI003C19EB99
MRVFFSNHSTAPVNLGGAERSLLHLVEHWQSRRPDLEPHFLTKAPEGQFIKALRAKNLPFTAYRFRGWALPSDQPAPAAEVASFATADYAAVTAMIREMEKAKPDLVVTNTIVAPWAAFAAKTLGIPHAWFVREYGDLDHGLQFQEGRDATLSDIGLLSEAVFTNSRAVEAHLAGHMDPALLSVVYPSVDAEKLAALAGETPAVEPFPQKDPGLRLVLVGRVEESKGQFRAIDALGELARRGVSASLCLVGSWKHPGYDLELRDRARALGVDDRIVFAGEQDNPFAFVARADVCLTASTIEAFGRTTLEYLTLGKPVVASNTGGSAELIQPGVNGQLFDLESTTGLADALESYATTPESIRAHGEAARQSIEHVGSGDTGLDAAIDRLESLVGAPAYRLPAIARYWFELPAAYSSIGGTSARAFAGLVKHRLVTRSGLIGRVLRSPRVVARRITGR